MCCTASADATPRRRCTTSKRIRLEVPDVPLEAFVSGELVKRSVPRTDGEAAQCSVPLGFQDNLLSWYHQQQGRLVLPAVCWGKLLGYSEDNTAKPSTGVG